MYRDLEHPEITCALRTGYPSWIQEDYGEDDGDDEAFEAYCDYLHEVQREQKLFGY